MANAGRIYCMTAAGRQAWESEDASVPAAYRRILGMAATETHADVMRGYLRRYPDALIFEWLAELEELGLLEPHAGEQAHDLDFTGSFPLPRLIAEDQARVAKDTVAAGGALQRKGVYLAADRLKHRPASPKTPAQTTVLIVEDDLDQLALADLRVKMAGFVVRTADSAKALRDALAEHGAPDVLLLDVMLPDGDGFDILASLRSHPAHALLPIVMLTVKDDPNDIRRGLTLGADGYVTKPYSKKLLADTLRQVLKLALPAS